MQKEILVSRLIAFSNAISGATASESTDLSDSAVAALIAIRAREPIAIQHIAGVVDLTHSATVRLIDRLEKDWLVRRQRRKGREVLVETTARGKRRVRDLHTKRTEAVGALVEGLGEKDRKALAASIDTILQAAVDGGADPKLIGRFCDPDTVGEIPALAERDDE